MEGDARVQTDASVLQHITEVTVRLHVSIRTTVISNAIFLLELPRSHEMKISHQYQSLFKLFIHVCFLQFVYRKRLVGWPGSLMLILRKSTFIYQVSHGEVDKLNLKVSIQGLFYLFICTHFTIFNLPKRCNYTLSVLGPCSSLHPCYPGTCPSRCSCTSGFKGSYCDDRRFQMFIVILCLGVEKYFQMLHLKCTSNCERRYIFDSTEEQSMVLQILAFTQKTIVLYWGHFNAYESKILKQLQVSNFTNFVPKRPQAHRRYIEVVHTNK